MAEAAAVPAYVVFPDRTLIEMAERKPATLDQMAKITGVGAKKLESYGALFLAVITGSQATPLHPQRMRLAGRDTGLMFDLLEAEQLRLARGEDGIGKHMTCGQASLRKIAEARPSTLSDMDRAGALGPQKLERFGAAFLEILRQA